MNTANLILSLPIGNITATSLGIEGLARHRSPGSGKHFHGRSIMVDLAMNDEKPEFSFFEEGGWRDAHNDCASALAGVRSGSRTKTALSNSAFNSVPVSAYRSCNLVKTAGAAMELGEVRQLMTYPKHTCNENMTTEQVAQAIDRSDSSQRSPRLYMVICPIQFIMLSNLTPEEYAWYATHRPGKIFRQVMFTEIRNEQPHIAAQSRFTNALGELAEKASKKTKTIVFDDCLDRIPFTEWIGYRHEARGGLYVGDRNNLLLYPFPDEIPHSWERVED